jgi:hypothetical protein
MKEAAAHKEFCMNSHQLYTHELESISPYACVAILCLLIQGFL